MKKFLNLSKIAIAVFLVMTVLKGDNPCPAVDPLDHTVLLPHESYSNLFYLCSNGVPILQRCPEGLHFDAYLNVCDWPQNVYNRRTRYLREVSFQKGAESIVNGRCMVSHYEVVHCRPVSWPVGVEFCAAGKTYIGSLPCK